MSPHSLILLAEDDENDAFLFRMALHKVGVLNPIAHARDGEEALITLRVRETTRIASSTLFPAW
jgi:hypothetical protein